MVHDPRFVEDLPEDVCCPARNHAAIPALIVCRNAHLLCQTCLTDRQNAWPISARDKMCPTCGEEMLSSPQPSRAVAIKLDQFTFKCRFADAGCQWTGQKVCRFRFLRCMRCCEQYRAGFAIEHNNVCTELVVACPRGGVDCLGPPRSGMYPRSQADKRARELCRNRPCRNFIFCSTRTSASNLVAHESACNFQLEQQGAARREAAAQSVQLAQAQADSAAFRARAERLEAALKSASEGLEAERRRRRELDSECEALADELRDEVRRYARLAARERERERGGGGGGPSGRRPANEPRFAPARQGWSPSRSRSMRDDRWAPIDERADLYTSRSWR